MVAVAPKGNLTCRSSAVRLCLSTPCRFVAAFEASTFVFASQECDTWSFLSALYSNILLKSTFATTILIVRIKYRDLPRHYTLLSQIDRRPKHFEMHSNKRMHNVLSILTFLLVLFLDVARAQNFLPTTSSTDFPGCGVGCNLLLQAQNLCVPPAVAVTSQFTYENCFCQSSLLQGLYSSPDAVCTAECTIESDRVLLQRWFTSFCSAVGQGVNPLATTAGTPTTVTQSVVVVTITSTNSAPGSTSTGTGSANRPAPETQSW